MAQRYMTKNKLMEEVLEWDSYIPKGANKLIMGTFPTAKGRRSFDFFYPNKNNPFWEILASVAKMELISAENSQAIPNRKNILDKLNLGITDIGYRIYRQDNSSLDQNIFPIEFMNVFEILDKHPSIEELIITSTSGKNSVEGWLRSYCALNRSTFPKLRGKNPKRGFLLNRKKEKIVDVLSVHSTSRAAGRPKKELISMYRLAVLGDI